VKHARRFAGDRFRIIVVKERRPLLVPETALRHGLRLHHERVRAERIDVPRDDLARALCEREHPPGVVTYLDGTPVGWCSISPLSDIPRLESSKLIRPIDDLPVWSILCFLVRPGFRRRGVTKALLQGAIAFARAAGAPALEAYPIDAEGSRLDVTLSYVGFTSTFEAAGFRRVVETAGKSAGRPRWLMRLDLDGGA
jgi:GNAT superfamily N-acetyltransferase